MRSVSIGCCIVIAFLTVSLGGCAPTYPRERLKESIIRICKNEYKIDVKVRTIGKTVAIYMPLENLMDFTFALTESATEKLNDVIMSVTRVVLSTDADYNFYCVIAHDVRLPEIQVIIIKYIYDVKRVFLGDISRGEFGKRTIVDMRLSPQSQKERSIKEVFQKIGLEQKWQDKVMNDFFRSEPTALGDVGYWGGRFYIKDITLSEFLAEQIAGRIKMEFRDDKKLGDSFVLRSAKGTYYSSTDAPARLQEMPHPAGGPYFKIEFLAENKAAGEIEAGREYDDALTGILRAAADVIHGYLFDKFIYIEIMNQADNTILKVSRDDLEKYRIGKIKFEQLAR